MFTKPIRSLSLSRGLTLIELMVALTIGLLLSFGLIRVFASSSEAYQALSQASQQIENGRYAIQSINEDLRLAGYYGEYAFAAAATGAPPTPCDLTTAGMRAALPFYVQGYNNVAGASPIGCLDIANIVAGTDILVVRRANTAVAGALVDNEVYIQANSDPTPGPNPVIAFGSQAGNFTLTKKDGVTLAEIRKYRVHVYFVSPCSEPVGALCDAAADGGRPIPTLKRLTLAVDPPPPAVGGVLTMRVDSIAEGIENLQIDFGVDTDNDGLPNGNFMGAQAVATWSDVMAAQIYVLARTPERVVGTADTKTYNMGVTANAITAPVGFEAFRRHLFTTQARLVNPAGRREVP